MKRLFLIVAAIVIATPLAAHAQERMSDSRFVSANRCLAYADHRALTSDAPNVEALRQTVRENTSRASPIARARADEVERRVKALRARSEDRLQRLREDRATACAPFVTQGLVQMAATTSAS
jgi:hypothetical protein